MSDNSCRIPQGYVIAKCLTVGHLWDLEAAARAVILTVDRNEDSTQPEKELANLCREIIRRVQIRTRDG